MRKGNRLQVLIHFLWLVHVFQTNLTTAVAILFDMMVESVCLWGEEHLLVYF